MAEKIITTKSFIGGRIVYPGETVDVDAKGKMMPAGSTPIGNLTVEQLRAVLEQRETDDAPEQFGSNVADEGDARTGSQPLEVAPFRPGAGVNPQGLPPGTVPHGDSFIRPAPDGSPVAVEEVVGAAAEPSPDSKFDHDGDGKPGGAPKGGNKAGKKG